VPRDRPQRHHGDRLGAGNHPTRLNNVALTGRVPCGVQEAALSAVPAVRRRHLVSALHEAKEMLRPGSPHPLPPHAFDQPDTPWPERDEPAEPSGDGLASGVAAVCVVAAAGLWAQQQQGAAPAAAPKAAAAKAAKTGKRPTSRSRGASPSASPTRRKK